MLKDDMSLDEDTINDIKYQIKTKCSPRHVPNKIIKTKGIPYTINGKKVEVAVKKIIDGEEVTNSDALSNPHVLDHYRNILELKG